MSVRCPSCGFDSADGAQWCEMCQHPFRKKKPANPLDGLSKEQLEKLDAANLLKAEAEKVPAVPPWLRPLGYTMLALWLALSGLALYALYTHYAESGPRPKPGLPAPGF